MKFSLRHRRGLSLLVVVSFLAMTCGVVPQARAATEAVRKVAGGVLGFIAGGAIMTALGVGGLAVLAGCVAGVYIGKFVGKNLNKFFKERKAEAAQAAGVVVGAAGAAAVAAAERLKEQEDKAAQFINSLTNRSAEPLPAQGQIDPNLDQKYQDAYRAYTEATQQGDTAASQKHFAEYQQLKAQLGR